MFSMDLGSWGEEGEEDLGDPHILLGICTVPPGFEPQAL